MSVIDANSGNLNKSNEKLGKSGSFKRMSATARITISAMLLTLLFGVIIIIANYFVYRNSAITYHATQAASIAEAVASVVDPDRLLASIQNDEADEYWHLTRRNIDGILHRVPNLTFLYIIIPKADGVFYYFASAVPQGIPEHYWLGFMVLEEDVDLYTGEATDALRRGTTVTTEGIAEAGEWGTLISAFSPVFDNTGRVIALVGADIDAGYVLQSTRSYTIIMSISMLAGALILGFLLRFRIIRTLDYSFKRIADGGTSFDKAEHFHVRDFDANSNEISSRLYFQYSQMFNSFRMLLNDIEKLAEAHNAGHYQVLIDESKYEGGHLGLVKQMNATVSNYVVQTEELVKAIKSFGEGNFNSHACDFKGDWGWVNKVMSDLGDNFVKMTRDIEKMAKNAADGELSKKIDVSDYQGDWNRVMQSLNRITEAVNAPIAEIRNSIAVLNAGSFNPPPVSGNYSGDFLAIKNDWNEYVKDLPTYMNEIRKSLDAIAEGDLTSPITKELVGDYGEVKKSINHIVANLHKTMKEISVAADQVLSGAGQISASASDLSVGAQEQTVSVQALNDAMDTIHRQTTQNADNALTANNLSDKSSTDAMEGNDAMQQMVEAMTQIKASSNGISQIVKTIQDIAFQTNLLALNASVEAARAGDHGKGFSVVAEEVRSLAGRSQEAASQTTALIQDSINRVDSGSNIAELTAKSLGAIVQSTKDVLSIISNISSASNEQAEAIKNVSDGLTQISSIALNNSAVSEETAAASEELNSQADILRQLVAFFRL